MTCFGFALLLAILIVGSLDGRPATAASGLLQLRLEFTNEEAVKKTPGEDRTVDPLNEEIYWPPLAWTVRTTLDSLGIFAVSASPHGWYVWASLECEPCEDSTFAAETTRRIMEFPGVMDATFTGPAPLWTTGHWTPEALHMEKPIFLEQCTGQLSVLMVVDSTGAVVEASIQNSELPDTCNTLALEAAREWRFRRRPPLVRSRGTLRLVLPFTWKADTTDATRLTPPQER